MAGGPAAAGASTARDAGATLTSALSVFPDVADAAEGLDGGGVERSALMSLGLTTGLAAGEVLVSPVAAISSVLATWVELFAPGDDAGEELAGVAAAVVPGATLWRACAVLMDEGAVDGATLGGGVCAIGSGGAGRDSADDCFGG